MDSRGATPITGRPGRCSNRLYNITNIAGVAVGFIWMVLIMLFVRDKLSCDKWIACSDKPCRVEVTQIMGGQNGQSG
jgi:hypothetical protein